MSGKNTEISLKIPGNRGTGRVWNVSDGTLRTELGEIVPLRQQSAKLLAALVKSPDFVISKGELLEAVWGNSTASDENLGQCITDLRKALDDGDHRVVRTHPRQGYSITIAPTSFRPSDTEGCVFRVSIVLLHEDPVAKDQMLEMAWCLESALNNFSTISMRQSGTPLSSDRDVEYEIRIQRRATLEGRHFGIQVINATSQSIVFDTPIDFSSARIEPERQFGIVAKRIEASILEDAAQHRDRLETPSAANYYLLGTCLLPDTAEKNAKARVAFEKSRLLHDNNPLVWASLAETHFIDAFLEYSNDFDTSVQKALEHVETAIAYGPRDSRPAWISGRIFYLLKEWDLAEGSFDRAIKLNPYDADAHSMRGSFLLHVGRPEEGIEALKRSIELNPERETRAYWALGAAYYNQMQFDLAVGALNEILIRRPSFRRPYRMVAAAYAMMGQVDRAQCIRESKLSDDPTNTLSAAEAHLRRTTRHQRDIDLVLTGFERAGFRQ